MVHVIPSERMGAKLFTIVLQTLFSAGNVIVHGNDLKTTQDETTDAVICPAKDVEERCDKETGVWTKTTTTYHLDGCQCKKQQTVKTGKCGKYTPLVIF